MTLTQEGADAPPVPEGYVRLTVEDAYAYGKFARVAAGTNDVDFRARPHSAEELEFLAAHVVGQGPETLDYARLEAASTVLCVALEPE